MADSATPGSTTGKHPSIKDKQCPFCQQPFTSSSLGRHLDLYIREKNAKAPDDVHDVEEIRKIRGGITRRQARSSTKRDGSTPSSTKATPLREQRSPSAQKPYSSAIADESGAVKTYWNTANWQATGVINDLPPTPREDQVAQFQRRTPSRRQSIKEEITRRQTGLEERDRGRAAELALKEVLESVKAANAKAHPSSPFDFNFFSLSFPQMYLKCLSPPPSLSSGAPTLHDASWSVDPPPTADYEVLRGWLHDKLHDWRRRRDNLLFGNNGSQNAINGQTPEQSPVHNEEALYYEHLSKTHQKWTELSAQAREQQWHYECARAFARELEKHQATARSLEHAEQEIQLLRGQIAQMNSNVLPPEFLHFPPTTLPFSREAASHLPDAKAPIYDSDAFIAKWKSRIRSARSTQMPLQASSWVPSRQPTNSNGSNRIDLLQRGAQQSHGSAQEQDFDAEGEEDAPGEEDEDAYEEQQQSKVLDPHLRGQRKAEQPQLRGSRRLMGLGAGYRGSEGTDVDMESG